MSIGKVWKMTKKQRHRKAHHYNWIYKVASGHDGHPGYKFFRRKKRFQPYMEGKVSMKKFQAMELWYWD